MSLREGTEMNKEGKPMQLAVAGMTGLRRCERHMRREGGSQTEEQ